MIKRSAFRNPLLKALDFLDNAIGEKSRLRFDTMSTLVCIVAGFSFGSGFLVLYDLFPPMMVIGIIVISLGFLIPMLSLLVESTARKVYSARSFGDGYISAPMYWAVCDVLEQRGINTPQKYFQSHPEHTEAVLALISNLHKEDLDEKDKIIALICTAESNPSETADLILSLVHERGNMSAVEYKALLEISGETSTPIMDGAL